MAEAPTRRDKRKLPDPVYPVENISSLLSPSNLAETVNFAKESREAARVPYAALVNLLRVNEEVVDTCVNAIAQQAASELLEEERKKGQLSSEDMNVALQRAEKHVREVFDKWAHDGRAECNRLLETLKKEGPEIYSQQEERATRLAQAVLRTMEDYRRGAVVLTTIEQYIIVQKQLEEAGFVFVSQCATKGSA
ncbi:hypothetical protein AK812_SmicGene1306 [Symbiodinium microadriaticum]|uniref:Uncharacterized protein n=1 Tax=Symbiodinium microadriaticum TaxID=2951 RepID=A0A1Q9F4B9_SYMMI|nr:hypothetical protein AK812_SmicGene1306 [Symbiodinium microadriaticum]